jgi:CubicO group peptidase (beta-lactamase class C family)
MMTKYRSMFPVFFMLFFLLGLTACQKEEEKPDDPSQMYFPPAGDSDWKKVSAVDLGWDTTSLNDAIRYARDHESNNLLIIYNGRFIAEEYWKGTTATSQLDINSIAKSMLSFVIGVLQEEGKLSIDDKVSKYLGTGWSQSPDTEADITIRHLLTMTSGLTNELGYASAPGESWRYSHMAFRVLYDVVKEARGSSARDYITSSLYAPLGMKNYTWTGYDIATSARELARFGLMILNDGTWDGKRLMNDQAYFSDMLTTSQSLNEAYGYLWWLNGTDSWYDDDTQTTFQGSITPSMPADGIMAKGFHEQRIYIVPSLKMVVIRQGAYTGLPESGPDSFDEGLWSRLSKAINKTPSGS